MDQSDFVQQALKALRPDTPNWYGWAKVDADGNKISNDQRMQTKYVIIEQSHIGKVTRPTDEEINNKIAELQADYKAKQYQRDRLREYPSIQECIHAILDDDLEALQARRSAVKLKYPKPE